VLAPAILSKYSNSNKGVAVAAFTPVLPFAGDGQELLLQVWNILPNDRPDAFRANPEVIVHDHVPEAREFTPSDFRVCRLKLT
jgi:hypothetical protein